MTDDPALRVRAWLDAPTWLPDAADDLRAVLAELLEYRNAITWETSCLSCSRMLDACRTADERAEKAEVALAEALPKPTCSCGGRGYVHLHAERHDPISEETPA